MKPIIKVTKNPQKEEMFRIQYKGETFEGNDYGGDGKICFTFNVYPDGLEEAANETELKQEVITQIKYLASINTLIEALNIVRSGEEPIDGEFYSEGDFLVNLYAKKEDLLTYKNKNTNATTKRLRG